MINVQTLYKLLNKLKSMGVNIGEYELHTKPEDPTFIYLKRNYNNLYITVNIEIYKISNEENYTPFIHTNVIGVDTLAEFKMIQHFDKIMDMCVNIGLN